MTPLIFLLVVLVLPLTALLVQHLQSRDRHVLAAIAREKSLHFAADDRFNLAPKIAELLPSPGAADVRVYDLMYGKEGSRYHFVFTVEWTEGVVRWKKRVRRVGSFSEDKDAPANISRRMNLKLAEQLCNLKSSRAEQYQSMYSSCCDCGKKSA